MHDVENWKAEAWSSGLSAGKVLAFQQVAFQKGSLLWKVPAAYLWDWMPDRYPIFLSFILLNLLNLDSLEKDEGNKNITVQRSNPKRQHLQYSNLLNFSEPDKLW